MASPVAVVLDSSPVFLGPAGVLGSGWRRRDGRQRGCVSGGLGVRRRQRRSRRQRRKRRRERRRKRSARALVLVGFFGRRGAGGGAAGRQAAQLLRQQRRQARPRALHRDPCFPLGWPAGCPSTRARPEQGGGGGGGGPALSACSPSPPARAAPRRGGSARAAVSGELAAAARSAALRERECRSETSELLSAVKAELVGAQPNGRRGGCVCGASVCACA